jgi:hypothetical protein
VLAFTGNNLRQGWPDKKITCQFLLTGLLTVDFCLGQNQDNTLTPLIAYWLLQIA